MEFGGPLGDVGGVERGFSGGCNVAGSGIWRGLRWEGCLSSRLGSLKPTGYCRKVRLVLFSQEMGGVKEVVVCFIDVPCRLSDALVYQTSFTRSSSQSSHHYYSLSP